jgi:protein-disulfide isomerase
MNQYLPLIIVSVVAMTALAGGSLLSQTMQPPRLDISPDKRIFGRGVVKSVHIRGNPEAAVTLEEFDFECPSCARLATFLDDLIKEYHPRVRLIFRNFPLAMHQIGAFLSNKKQGSAADSVVADLLPCLFKAHYRLSQQHTAKL